MKIVEKECGECGLVVAILPGDYLCIDCRATITEVGEMDGKCRAIVDMAIQLWPGWVMVKDDTPEDVDHGWVQLALVEPDSSSQGFAMATYLNGYAIWKYTGEIYRLGRDEAVEDSTVSRAEFIAHLTTPNRTVI